MILMKERREGEDKESQEWKHDIDEGEDEDDENRIEAGKVKGAWKIVRRKARLEGTNVVRIK